MKNKKFAIPYKKNGKIMMIPGINNFGDKGYYDNHIHTFNLSGKGIIPIAVITARGVTIHNSIEIKFGEN